MNDFDRLADLLEEMGARIDTYLTDDVFVKGFVIEIHGHTRGCSFIFDKDGKFVEFQE